MFLESSASVLLFWLRQTTQSSILESKQSSIHPESKQIRTSLVKSIEFYEKVIIPMCLHDLNQLFPKFIKRLKRIAYE